MSAENTSNTKTQKQDTGGLVISSLFIVIGAVMLWDTTNMLDSDSFVFPRAIAIVMIFLNILLIARILMNMVTSEKSQEPAGASTMRRVALICGMLISCAMMPYLGFFLSAIITFLLLMIVSMYDEWTFQRKLIYPAVAVAVVAGFYGLFSKILLVPLPTGMLF